MMRCVAKFRDGYANIKADRLVRDDSIIMAFLGCELVAVFDVGVLDVIYLTEGKE